MTKYRDINKIMSDLYAVKIITGEYLLGFCDKVVVGAEVIINHPIKVISDMDYGTYAVAWLPLSKKDNVFISREMIINIDSANDTGYQLYETYVETLSERLASLEDEEVSEALLESTLTQTKH